MAYVINFFFNILGASLLINWLYFKNNRSIIVGIVFHFLLDLFYVMFRTDHFTQWVSTVIIFLIIIILVMRDREFFFHETAS